MRLSRLTSGRIGLLLLLALLLALLPATALAGPPQQPFAGVRAFLPCIQPGSGSLHGRISDWPSSWPDFPVRVWLAAYWPLGEDGNSGVWVLDPVAMPSCELDADNAFHFGPVAPGRYCLVVGTTPPFMAPVRNEYGLAAVFRVEAGEDTDVGNHVVWTGW